MSTPRTWLLVAGAGLVLALHALTYQPWTVDDAYITFRYARNVLEGHGPVYNPGEWVEGYTSPLWLALLTAGGALGVPLPWVARILGGASALGCLALLAHLPSVPPRAAAFATVWLATCGMLSAWSLGGLEPPLAALLVLGMLAAHLADRPGAAGLLGALATLTRPELLLTVGVFAVQRRWQWFMGAFAGLFVPVWAARWALYGWPFPNTFYAKVGATSAQVVRGLGHLGELGGAMVGLGVLCLAGIGAREALVRDHGPLVARLVAVLGVHTAYVVAVGGDALPAFRFFVPVLGPAALLGGLALTAWPRHRLVVLAVAVVANLAAGGLHPELTTRIWNGRVGRNGIEVGAFLGQHFPPDTLLATNAAGSVPWASKLPTIDMLGLNDAHIAHRDMPRMGRGAPGHEKADGAYVLSRSPDLVLFGAARGRREPVFRSDRELWQQPGFREHYVFERYELPSGKRVSLYRRRDFTPPGRPTPTSRPR